MRHSLFSQYLTSGARFTLSLLLTFALCSTAVAQQDKDPKTQKKSGGFLRGLGQAIKEGAKEGVDDGLNRQKNPSNGIPNSGANSDQRSKNPLSFADVSVADVRLGMSESAALEVIRRTNPSLIVTSRWLSVQNNNGGAYNGALGTALPQGASPVTAAGGPYVKIGAEAASGPANGTCVVTLRPGIPNVSPQSQDRICERIWLQTSPDEGDAKVIAVSRILVFGGSTKPPISGFAEDLLKKYGQPSESSVVAAPALGGVQPVTFVWEFDGAGHVKAHSDSGAVDDTVTGWGVPAPYAPGGYSGRIPVISQYGPEFTAGITKSSPRLLAATITPDIRQPLLAARLSIIAYDPATVMANIEDRIAMHNKLVNEIRDAVDRKQKEDASKAANRPRPKL